MKKGFTLIELLAVIVILAVIAIIATPIILDIISNAKDSSDDRSVELYLKTLQNKLAISNINGEFNIDYCVIEDSVLTCGDKVIDVVENTKPEDGRILFLDGKIAYYNLNLNDKNYKKSIDDNLLPYQIEIDNASIKTEKDGGVSVYYYLNDYSNEWFILYSEKPFSNVILFYNGLGYLWIMDEATVNAINELMGSNYECKRWYYASQNDFLTNGSNLFYLLEPYNGSSPIDLDIISNVNDNKYVKYYIDRVLLSFEN